MLRFLTPLFFSLLFSFAAYAAEPDLTKIRGTLGKAFPGTKVDKIRPAPMSGLYEIQLDAQVLYISADAKFLFFGDLVDVSSRTNLTEHRRGAIAVRLIDEIGEKRMIVMGPAKPKRTITVFTDVDCPYCVKFHLDVPTLTKEGVKVRYLMFPRSGIGAETYKRSVAVWCAADRVKAVGIAKARGKLEMKTCPNPVEDHYRLGERLGVSGTPTIFLDDGRRIGGYLPPARLLPILGLKPKARAAKAR